MTYYFLPILGSFDVLYLGGNMYHHQSQHQQQHYTQIPLNDEDHHHHESGGVSGGSTVTVIGGGGGAASGATISGHPVLTATNTVHHTGVGATAAGAKMAQNAKSPVQPTMR